MKEQSKNKILPWNWFEEEDHINIRKLGHTLNALNFIEISVVLFFCYISHEMIFFVMDQITLGSEHMVLGVLATGVFIPLVGGIWSMLKNINDTFKDKE